MAIDLAKKYLERGLKLSQGEDAWAAYHLAKEVADLRECLQALHEEVEMAESIGICLGDRTPSLRASKLLSSYPKGHIDGQ